MKKSLIIFGKSLTSIISIAILVFASTMFCPVYDFMEPTPFTGPKIYNPYATLDTTIGWAKSNFHSHTRPDTDFFGDYRPGKMWKDYSNYGYDILGFSDHNHITLFPDDTTRQISLYEHGYNWLKFHKLVFGAEKVSRYDNFFPFFTFQKQNIIDVVGKDADFLVFAHPDRTRGIFTTNMEHLTGYRLLEADSGPSTELKRWDEALSAGHFSFVLCNDDCHDSSNPKKTALRCSWLNTDSHRYEDIKEILLNGCFYSMRLPNDKKHPLAYIDTIGIRNDTLFMTLSRAAQSIEIVGQDGKRKEILYNTNSVSYYFAPEDTYIRFSAFFEDGMVLYTNPFARYSGDELFSIKPHSVNLLLTILYNLLILSIIVGAGYLILRLWKQRRK